MQKDERVTAAQARDLIKVTGSAAPFLTFEEYCRILMVYASAVERTEWEAKHIGTIGE